MVYLLPWVAVNYQQHTSVCHNFSLFLAFQFEMPSANKQVSWPQNVDVLPLFNLEAELRGAQHPSPLSAPNPFPEALPEDKPWLCCSVFSCLLEGMTPRRAVYVLFLNYLRFYTFNNLPFKWAETLLCSPLLLHVLCACNTTHSFGYASLQGELLEQGLHVTV